MSDAGFRSSILADDSGRRRRRLRWLGRGLTVAFLLWLGVLGLGTLGLQPVGGLPVVGLLPERAAPPELPTRVQAAVSRHEVVRLAPGGALGTPTALPRPTAPSGRARPPGAPPAGNGAARRAARPAPAPPGLGAPPDAALPVRPVAPGQAVRPVRTRTAPGRPTAAPGLVTEPVPPQSHLPAWGRGRPLDEDLPEPARERGPG